MTDKPDSERWSLAKAYRLSDADTEILELSQRIMIGRCEAAWIGAREGTCHGEERRRLSDRRLELYGQIDKDMGSLEGYCPESLYAAQQMLEVVLDVLAHRLIDHEGWLGGSAIERMVVAVLGRVTSAAAGEANGKRLAVHVVPVQGRVF